MNTLSSNGAAGISNLNKVYSKTIDSIELPNHVDIAGFFIHIPVSIWNGITGKPIYKLPPLNKKNDLTKHIVSGNTSLYVMGRNLKNDKFECIVMFRGLVMTLMQFHNMENK